ncbi:MAG TPA: hypothetical protein VLC09_15730 [Polyangiaceae bacterium]|nr:hypothetical protein [Polyangiaceae bacterium]
MHLRAATLAVFLLSSLLTGCGKSEPEKPKPLDLSKAPVTEPEPEPEAPARKRAPAFTIDDVSVQVGFSRSNLTQPNGAADKAGIEQFEKELGEAKEFIDGQTVTLEVKREAQVSWVASYIEELYELGASGVKVKTDTRSDYPSEVSFVAASRLGKPDGCSAVGMIGDDKSTLVWKLSGGAAQKRQKGMGGPDLTITGDTLLALAKKCSSDLFVAQGQKTIVWGFVYDFAASAMALEGGPFKRASVPTKRPTPGQPVSLARE